MATCTYHMSPCRIQRPGLPPRVLRGEVASDEPILHIDAAIGFLHGAEEFLELERQSCAPRSERVETVSNLFARVREIRHALESMSMQ